MAGYSSLYLFMEETIIPKYCDSGSILLVNSVGNLKRLYCPFLVKCCALSGALKPGMSLWVEEVATNEKDELIYIILGSSFKHTHFKLLASF
jgi:hypothetical protein